MYNFFVKNEHFTKDTATILGEDVNHIKNVLRLSLKESIYVCDKDSHTNFLWNIEEITESKINCKIIQKIEETTEKGRKSYLGRHGSSFIFH